MKLLNNLQFKTEGHHYKALRYLALSHPFYNASGSADGGDSSVRNRGTDGKKTSKGGDGNGRDGQLRCPKCGAACSHVETFVSKFIKNLYIFINVPSSTNYVQLLN